MVRRAVLGPRGRTGFLRHGDHPCQPRADRALPQRVVGAGRQRPAAHRLQPASDADRRAVAADRERAGARPGPRRSPRPQRPDRGSQAGAPDQQRGRLLVLVERRRPVPGQLLLPDGQPGDGAADHPAEAADLRRAGPAAGDRVLRQPAPGPGARDRADRLGQVDVPRRDDRLHQREPALPHPHDRGPGRVRARAQELGGQPARGRLRHAVVRPGAAGRAAGRPRRHPRR